MKKKKECIVQQEDVNRLQRTTNQIYMETNGIGKGWNMRTAAFIFWLAIRDKVDERGSCAKRPLTVGDLLFPSMRIEFNIEILMGNSCQLPSLKTWEWAFQEKQSKNSKEKSVCH